MLGAIILAAHCARAADPAINPAPQPDFSKVPGIIIDHSPASSGQYIGSPSILALAGGDYLASHDLFGPKSTEHTSAITRIFRSADKGLTWTRIAEIDGAFWSTLFEHKGAVYLIGPTHHHGSAVIRRSSDGGRTWTTPRDRDSGLLLAGQYHCAPMPVVVHDGRIWRAIEDASNGTQWGKRYSAMMLAAPVEADLLKAENWTASNFIPRDPKWKNGTFNAWLEGNAVVGPEGKMLDILRVDAKPDGDAAAIVQISADGKTASFDPATGFIHFPGGCKKFAIRFDPASKLYWSLSNYVPPQHAAADPGGSRNTLALVSSPDLKEWTVKCILLYHPDRAKHGFQYVDWLFDGDDIIAACRTAFDDGLGGAHNAHDANFLTFHRVKNFRGLTMKDSVPITEAAPRK